MIMTRIGIIFAMKEELDAFLKFVQLEQEYSLFELSFFECSFDSNKLILVESGVGKVNAARCCQILIDNMNIDYIFNVGVAGGISPKVHVLDLVVGEKLVQHDFDITAFQHEKGFIPNIGNIFIPSDDYLIRLSKEVSFEYPVHQGIIASGDIFCTEKKMSEKIHHRFSALCVEMEGASIAQVCYLSHIPYLVIRWNNQKFIVKHRKNVWWEENSRREYVDTDNYIMFNTLTYEEFLDISSMRVAQYLERLIKLIIS